MEAVIFDGKEYVKASVVAERFKYTQDYIGQLCRGKKVDARLVGRAWYINLESLHSHKKARYKSPEIKSETDSPRVPEKYLSRIDVEPVLKKKTVKILKNAGNKLSEFPVIYENDDFSLIPHVNRNSITKTLPILPAEAEEVSVASTKESLKVTNFAAEPLPEVYLKGILRVDGLPETLEEEVIESTPDKSELAIDSPEIYEDKQPVLKETLIQETQVNPKNPIKIRLYRGESKASPRSLSPRQNIDFGNHRPGLVEKKAQNHMVRQLLPVKETTLSQNNPVKHRNVLPNQVEKDIEIPYATLKAVLILGTFTLVAVGLLSLKEISLTTNGLVVAQWQFSLEQLQEIRMLFHTK